MTRTVTIDSVDWTSQIRLESFSFTQAANRGEVGTGGFNLLDETAIADVPAMKAVVFTDTAAVGSNTTFNGFTHDRVTQRGIQRIASAREWSVELVDLNVLASDYVISEDDDGDRPEETDYERITWLLTTRFGISGAVAAGVVPNTNTVTMDKTTYLGRPVSDVLGECSEAAGKMWFVYDYGAGHLLYYDLATGTSLTSTAKISDVFADVDNSTVWGPFGPPTVTRSPDRIYSSIIFNYKNGSVRVTNDTTESTYRPRETTVDDQSVLSYTLAVTKAEAFLDGAANEILRIDNLALVMPNSHVNDIREGMRVQVKLTRHGIDAYTYYRVIRRTIQPFGGTVGASDTEYVVSLGLLSDVLASANGGRDDGPPDDTGECGQVIFLPSGVRTNLSLESGGGPDPGQIFVHDPDAARLVKYRVDLQTKVWDVTASGGVGYVTHQPGTFVPACLGDRGYRRDDGTLRWSIQDEIAAVAAQTQDARRFWVSGTSGTETAVGFPYSGMGSFSASFGPTSPSLNYTVWRGFVTGTGSVHIASGSTRQMYFFGTSSNGWAYEKLHWVTDPTWNDSGTPPSVADLDTYFAGTGDIGTRAAIGTGFYPKATGWYSFAAITENRPEDDSSGLQANVASGQWVLLVLADEVGGSFDQTSVAHGLQFDFTVSGTATLDAPLTEPGGPVLQVRETIDGTLVDSIDLGDDGDSMRRSASGQFAMLQQGTDTILRYDKSLTLDDTVTIADFFPNDDWAVDDAYNLYQLGSNVLTKYDPAGSLLWTVDLADREGYAFPSLVTTGTGNQVIADDFVRVVGTVSSKAVLLTLAKSTGDTKDIHYFTSDDTAQAEALHHHATAGVYVAGSATGTTFEGETMPSNPVGWIIRVCQSAIDSAGEGGVDTSHTHTATQISYDHSASGASATDVQGALDELFAESSTDENALKRIDGGEAAITTVLASGSALTLDLSAANHFHIVLTANCTLTFSNPPASGVLSEWGINLVQGGSGGYTVTWPASVSWRDTDGTPTSSAPTLATAVDAQDAFTVNTQDGGTSYGAALDNGGSGSSTTVATDTIWDAKGDLAVGTGADTASRLAVGTDGYVPIADSAQTTGIRWAAGARGPILISDTPSTPLVFADLLQNDAQDDLLYGDI